MDENGFISYRSRQKDLIIVGGINVYPVEVENVLLEHPTVGEAQVFGVSDQRYGEVVCAWVKPRAQQSIDNTDELREYLASKLAFFKIPKHIKVVDSFAGFMTPTGKVQKFKLIEAMSQALQKQQE
jgi:fatty-acyl-CoA synthase